MEEAFSSADAHSELSYASEDKENKYVAFLVENSVPILVSAPLCQENTSTICPVLEETVENPGEPIAEDLDALLRELDQTRCRDLWEGQKEVFHCSLVYPRPRVSSRERRSLTTIRQMVPGGSRGGCVDVEFEVRDQ